ncbi:hypothetical protein HanIR_Chr10g0499281 [Helianthus annuus]|nr:hypothetical protein HanIR_Chr10g0499281 [Helianthus annuus]
MWNLLDFFSHGINRNNFPATIQSKKEKVAGGRQEIKIFTGRNHRFQYISDHHLKPPFR